MTDFAVDRVAKNGVDFHSDSIETVAYDAKNKTLFVEFSHGFAAYAYSDVEESTYNLFITADSLNAFWRKHVSGDAERYNFAEFYLRGADDEIDLKPDTKWASVPEGETPDFALGGPVSLDESILALGTLTIPVVQPSRYVVQWTSDEFNGAGPFKPEFQAVSEADALAQFNAQVNSAFGTGLDVRIQAVTHYLD